MDDVVVVVAVDSCVVEVVVEDIGANWGGNGRIGWDGSDWSLRFGRKLCIIMSTVVRNGTLPEIPG